MPHRLQPGSPFLGAGRVESSARGRRLARAGALAGLAATAFLAFLSAPTARADDDPAATTERFRLFQERGNAISPDRFTFVRVQYDSVGSYGEAYYDYDGRRWLRWETDFPEAEENLLYRMGELSTLEPNPRAEVRRLTDPDLGDFPLLYFCDVGWMSLTKDEIVGLRGYLERGGFVWVDDFWGHAEWESFESMMKECLPANRWRDIPADDPILSIVFPLKGCPQIPARDFALQGWKYDPPFIHKAPTSLDPLSDGVEQVNFRGWYDARGRLMVVATHNTDVGDGWERESEDPWYFETYSTPAFAMGINIIVYAMTH